MEKVPSDKYSVAWFKLAEFVERREKERALGIYKLLALSLDDPAFSEQLAGDLLLCFDDQEALAKYDAAATLYFQQKKYTQAAAVYEHLATIAPDPVEYLTKLVTLYTDRGQTKHALTAREQLIIALIKNNNPVHEHIAALITVYAAQHETTDLDRFIKKLESLSPEHAHYAYSCL